MACVGDNGWDVPVCIQAGLHSHSLLINTLANTHALTSLALLALAEEASRELGAHYAACTEFLDGLRQQAQRMGLLEGLLINALDSGEGGACLRARGGPCAQYCSCQGGGCLCSCQWWGG